MTRPPRLILLIVSLCAISVRGDQTNGANCAAPPGNWPQWRGPLANGVAPQANPPVSWDETNNVRWKVPMPGKAHSSPIVFGDSVYVLSALPVGEAQKPVYDDAPGVHDSVPVTHRHQFLAIALRRRDGQVSWSKVLREEWPHEGGHQTGSLASNSPVTDGERLYVFFGSRGLYCLDLNGEVKWQKDLGRMHTLHAHGEGSSPVLIAIRLLFVGIKRPIRSFTLLISTPAKYCGRLLAMKRPPGQHRSSLKIKARPR